MKHLTNGVVQSEGRPGWALSCPACAKEVLYTVLNISPGEDIYLYCDACPNFTLREEDRRKMLSVAFNGSDQQFDLIVGALYECLERELPSCGCGGKFKIWSNVRCPHCDYEFPYNNGLQDASLRYGESKVVWVEGAIAYRGALIPSNKLEKVTVENRD